MHSNIIRQTIAFNQHHHHHHKHVDKNDVNVVNNLKVCLREASEIRQIKLIFEQLVKIEKLCMMKKMFMQEILMNGEGEKKLKR
jgi:hypothetical protein